VFEYLSDPWIHAMDEAVAHHAGLAAATADITLVVQQHVTATAGADGTAATARSYHVIFDHGRNAVRAGEHATPDVTFTCDRATAARIATAEESAQGAFMAGRLRIAGDSRVLIANQTCFAALDDVTAGVRAATEFGS
jgi:hypothetical protein